MTSKNCNDCGEVKVIEEFYSYKKTTKKRGEYIYYHPECKSCTIRRSKEWRAAPENREKWLAMNISQNAKPTKKQQIRNASKAQRLRGDQKIWQINNLNKIKIYNNTHRVHDIAESEWKKCLEVFDNECAYCSLPYEQHIVKRSGKYITMNFHKDHVDDNGSNDLRNAVPSCQSCNCTKHVSSLDDWYKVQEFFNESRYNKIIWWITEGYKKYIEDKPPYRIIKRKNEDSKTFHWELWSVDEYRNMVECLKVTNKKKDLL